MPTIACIAPVRRVRIRPASALLVVCAIAGCGPRTPPPDPAATPALRSPASNSPASPPATQPAPPSQAAAVVPPWLAALRLMDRDGDGRVSLAEHAAAAGSMFTRMDGDGDGRVTVDEMATVRSTLPGARAETEAMLRAVDANGDGVLDRDEHAASTRREFDVVDTNHDGFMSAAELQAADTAGR